MEIVQGSSVIIMRNEVIEAIKREKIIVIIRGVKSELLVPLAEAMYKGGIRLIEVTYSADKTVSDEATAENIRSLCTAFEGRMYIGAGTVLEEKQVELTKEAGGSFIISPDVCECVIHKTRELNMVSMPGAVTPTEMQTAHKAGADFIKIFPAVNLGPAYIKAVKAPLSHISFTAVGGINENNIGEYLKAGVSGFGIGANIVKKDMLENGDYDGITELAKKYVETVKRG